LEIFSKEQNDSAIIPSKCLLLIISGVFHRIKFGCTQKIQHSRSALAFKKSIFFSSKFIFCCQKYPEISYNYTDLMNWNLYKVKKIWRRF